MGLSFIDSLKIAIFFLFIRSLLFYGLQLLPFVLFLQNVVLFLFDLVTDKVCDALGESKFACDHWNFFVNTLQILVKIWIELTSVKPIKFLYVSLDPPTVWRFFNLFSVALSVPPFCSCCSLNSCLSFSVATVVDGLSFEKSPKKSSFMSIFLAGETRACFTDL